MNRQNERSELQERLAAELNEKAKKKSQQESVDRPDGVDDSNFIVNTDQSSKLLGLWLVVFVVAVAVIIVLVVYG